MKTISFSIEDDVAKDIGNIARREHKSKSDILRDMYENYVSGRSFTTWLRAEQRRMSRPLKDLGIETEQDLELYLESDQIYEDRIRQQRISSGR